MSVVFSDENKSHMTGMSKSSMSKMGHNLLAPNPEGGIQAIIANYKSTQIVAKGGGLS